MKLTGILFSTMVALAVAYSGNAHGAFGKTHYSLRPQGTNNARLMLGTADKIHLYGTECFYGVGSIALEYQQTFNDCNLGSYFFFNGKNRMTFGDGSGNYDVSSINFGLSETFTAKVCATPTIKNFTADVDFWFGLDDVLCGLWTRLEVPLVWTHWYFGLTEENISLGSTHYSEGSVSAGSPSVVYANVRDAWCGNNSFGDAPPLKYGKICCGARTNFDAAGVRWDVGYDWWRTPCGFAGLALTVVAGVGTEIDAEYLFQPVVGAQRAWQCGATFTGGYELWNINNECIWSVFVDATFVHLFCNKQQRLFGLRGNGSGSQYLLLKKFTQNAEGEPQFNGQLERAANILGGCANISAQIMADIDVLFTYRTCGFGASAGAGVWARSAERFSQCCNPFSITPNTYGIKGGIPSFISEFAVQATSSTSTIGKDGPVDETPIFIAADGFNPNIALHPSALSGKIFGSLDYAWDECEWQPYVLIGGEAEFGRCNTAVTQWGFILKGGICF